MLRLLYRLILRLSPPPVRHEYGREMEEIFLHCVAHERRRRARAAWPAAELRGLVDAAAFAWFARTQSWPAVASYPFGITYGRRRGLVRRQDLQSAFRLVRTRPLFAAAVVGMLALGLGATTAIFSVIHGVLLRPLPFPEPDRLVRIWMSVPGRAISRTSLTEGYTWDIRDMNRSLEEYGAYHSASYTITAAGEAPVRLNGAYVSVGFLRALGAPPVIGRLFAPGEDAPGRESNLAILSSALWRTRFGADRGVVGRTVVLDGRPYQVIGVLPPSSAWFDTVDVFVPFVQRLDADRGSWEFASVGRLKPGVTQQAAEADLDRVAREIEERHPATDKGYRIAVGPSSDWVATPTLRRTLWMLLGAVGLLLVIACVNATNLLLAHAAARARETAVRTALGAGRWDVIRERLTESLVLSLGGALAAWPLAAAMLRGFQTFGSTEIPRLADASINGWMLMFTFGVALLVGIGTGLVPAWRSSSASAAQGLRHGQRTTGDRRDDRTRTVFVGVEVALSLVLLVGAGLLVRSLAQVLSVDRGFQTENRLLATVSLPSSYPVPRREQIVTELLSRLEHATGVGTAALVSSRPLASGSSGMGIVAADHDLPESSVPWASWRIITKDYFTAMGLSVVAGRGFTQLDIIEKPWRVVISRRLAELLWPGENPVGKTALLWKGQGNQRAEVIGVVSDMRERGLENPPTLAVYLPAYGAMGVTTVQVILRTEGHPEQATDTLRRVVAELDPTLPVSGVRTLEDVVAGSVASRRFTMLLLAVFAGVALVLTMAGVYGVLAYTVARRTADIGVRMALGAEPARVLRGVFSRGMRPVAAGVAIGLAGAFWASRLMASLLFQIEPHDAATYTIVTAALLAIASLACYLPARRVLRVDPIIALRTE